MSFVKTKFEINENEYNKLIAIENDDRKAFNEIIEDMACHSSFHPAGYGFYSPRVYKENDNYFVSWEHWDSCD